MEIILEVSLLDLQFVKTNPMKSKETQKLMGRSHIVSALRLVPSINFGKGFVNLFPDARLALKQYAFLL